jgi:catechol 2,3-dioxygenase-like lactoylglutathione lyase family enzyme
MKRLHIHIGVQQLEESIRFYNALFGTEPAKTKPGYAKWMLENPSLNFAISTGVAKPGVDHVGIQVDEEHELAELRDRFSQADMAVYDEGETVCCYARSDKTWVQDPSGLPWEAYRTMEEAEVFSERTGHPDGACCTQKSTEPSDCCEHSKAAVECCG